MNNPLHRYCDRCWNLHPGWLPEQLLSLQRKGCSCTSWSQDHKNHIASARTQAWAEHVNKSLCRQDVSEPATLESTERNEIRPSAIPSIVPPSHTDATTPVDLPSTPSDGHDDTGSIPCDVYSGVGLTRSDTMPVLDCLARRHQANSIGDSMRTSSVISADSADTDILVSSVARDDSGIGLGLCSLIPDCDDLAMADIYKNGPRDISTPTTPKQFTIESCVSSDSLQSSFDANHTNEAANNVAQSSGMCVICLTRPKEASIIHGNTGHQVCCYICAKRLQHRRMSCPVCRRPISGVIRNYWL